MNSISNSWKNFTVEVFDKERQKREYCESKRNVDKETLKKIVGGLLPYETMEFVKTHPFEYPFSLEKIKHLYEFENKKGVSLFFDSELEQIKEELATNIKTFNNFLLSTTTIDGRGNRIIQATIRRDTKKSQKVYKKLNQFADEVWKSYTKLIKAGEKRGFNARFYHATPFFSQEPIFGKNFLIKLVNYYF